MLYYEGVIVKCEAIIIDSFFILKSQLKVM